MESKARIVIKESALNDLEKEYRYYSENYSIEYAERFRFAFFEEIKYILPNPFAFPECRFLHTKHKIYRNIVWKNYLIIFKIKKTFIEVLVLFHTKQPPEN